MFETTVLANDKAEDTRGYAYDRKVTEGGNVLRCRSCESDLGGAVRDGRQNGYSLDCAVCFTNWLLTWLEFQPVVLTIALASGAYQ